MAFLKAVKTRQIKKCIQHKKREFNSSLWLKISSVLRRGPSCLHFFPALCLCFGEMCPDVEFVGPKFNAGAHTPHKDTFPLNKYCRGYPAKSQPQNTVRSLRKPSVDRAVAPFLPVSIPTVLPLARWAAVIIWARSRS